MQDVFQAIPTVLKQLEGHDGAVSAIVFAAWRKTAGEQLRSRTTPIGFSQKRLVLAVENETWKRHLQDLSGEMLYGLNGLLGHGAVKFIEFQINEAAIARPSNPKRSASESDDKSVVTPELRTAADKIGDPHLRESFLAAAASYLARQQR